MDYCTSDMCLFVFLHIFDSKYFVLLRILTMLQMMLAEIFVHKYLYCSTVSVKFSNIKFNKFCTVCCLQSYFTRCSAHMLVCLWQTGNTNRQYYVHPCSGVDDCIIAHFCISEALNNLHLKMF